MYQTQPNMCPIIVSCNEAAVLWLVNYSSSEKKIVNSLPHEKSNDGVKVLKNDHPIITLILKMKGCTAKE